MFFFAAAIIMVNKDYHYRNRSFYVGRISLPVIDRLLQCLYLAPFLRYYHFWSECDWR